MSKAPSYIALFYSWWKSTQWDEEPRRPRIHVSGDQQVNHQGFSYLERVMGETMLSHTRFVKHACLGITEGV